jgi:hypothetical protein
MKRQQAASLFWLAFSILVIYGAWRLGIGSLSVPGVGFMSFGAACFLLIFSSARLIGASLTNERKTSTEKPLFSDKLWWRVVAVIGALLAYSYVLTLFGYIIATFLLTLILLWVAGVRKIWKTVVYSLCMTVVTHLVFSKCLKCQFPIGPFGF